MVHIDGTPRKGETPAEAMDTVISAPKASSNNRQFQTLRNPSEQRKHARHARHLPSRSLAALTDDGSKVGGATAAMFAYATLRKPKTPMSPTEEHAMNIARQMELDENLMQDDPIAELLRMETLRDLPQGLTVKRSIKASLSKSVSQKKKKRKPIGCWTRFKYRMSICFMKIGMWLREISSTMELWYHPIKSIEGHFGSGVATYFKFLRWLFLLNVVSCILSLGFIVLPQSLLSAYSGGPFEGMDILTGSGFFENTIMYYGFYSNTTVSQTSSLTYSIPSTYIMTMLFCYISTFILLSIKVAISYRKSFIETAGGLHNLYANKIFCGWDFGIASSKAANLRSAFIYGELKELLSEGERRANPNCATRSYTLVIQVSITALVLTVMAAIGYLLWTLLSRYEMTTANMLSFFIVPTVITIIMNIFPAFFSWLVRFEGYSSKRTALYVTMVRVYSMAVLVVGTLLAFWLHSSATGCWQTALAQEIYRLILVDFIVSIIGTFLFQMIRSKLHSMKCMSISPPRFNIARNTLNLIYNQTLFWVAFYFSPPMSLVILIKMFLIFYVKKYGVLNHCEPPSRSWRAAQTHTLFLALVFLGMVGILLVLGYIITTIPTSECGPFRDYEYTWKFVVEGVFQLKQDSVFMNIISVLWRPGFGAAILIGMCVAVYYLQAKADASKVMVQILREMLVLQAEDKAFLLSGISKVADEHWLYHNNSIESPRPSVTGRQNEGFVLSSAPTGRRNSAFYPRTPKTSVVSNSQHGAHKLESFQMTSVSSAPAFATNPKQNIPRLRSNRVDPTTSEAGPSSQHDVMY